jgi:hypothetical protein
MYGSGELIGLKGLVIGLKDLLLVCDAGGSELIGLLPVCDAGGSELACYLSVMQEAAN